MPVVGEVGLQVFRHVNLPGSEEGHEEHLDENDGGVEGDCDVEGDDGGG